MSKQPKEALMQQKRINPLSTIIAAQSAITATANIDNENQGRN